MKSESVKPRKGLSRLFFGFAPLLILLEIPFLLNHSRHGYFVVDGWLAFYAVLGFLACIVVTFTGQFFARFLKQDADFYHEEESTLPEDIDESLR